MSAPRSQETIEQEYGPLMLRLGEINYQIDQANKQCNLATDRLDAERDEVTSKLEALNKEFHELKQAQAAAPAPEVIDVQKA